MASLIATNTKLTCEEILMPTQMTAVRISTIAAATRLCPSPYAQPGMVMPASSITSAKYVDQPTATVLAPEGQLEDQVPADDPGDELAEAGVGERVRRAGHRHRARELRVAERGQRTGDAGEHERQRDRRSGLLPGRLTGQHEDAGADDDADAEHGQLDGPSSLRSWCSAPRCRRSTARRSSCA